MTKRLLSILCLLPLTGCASFSTFGLARTLNQGAVQGWVAPSGGGAVTTNTTAGSTNASIGYPLLEGGARYGVTDHVELGARLGFNGVTLEGKFAVARSESMDRGVNFSIAPAVGFIGFGESAGTGGSSSGAFVGVLSFHLPFLFGIDFGGHELVFGPRIVDQVLFGTFSTSSGTPTSVANVFYLGGSIGVAIRAGSSFRIVPEVAIGVPTVETVANTGSSAFGALIFQAGVGFLFGSSNQYDPPRPPPPPQPEPPPPPPAQ